MTTSSPPYPPPTRLRAIDRLELTANQLGTVAARLDDPSVWWLHGVEELTRHVTWQLRLAEACPQLHGIGTPSWNRTRALVQAVAYGELVDEVLAPVGARCRLAAHETCELLAAAMANEDLTGPAAAVRLQVGHLDRLADLHGPYAAEVPTAKGVVA